MACKLGLQQRNAGAERNEGEQVGDLTGASRELPWEQEMEARSLGGFLTSDTHPN